MQRAISWFSWDSFWLDADKIKSAGLNTGQLDAVEKIKLERTRKVKLTADGLLTTTFFLGMLDATYRV